MQKTMVNGYLYNTSVWEIVLERKIVDVRVLDVK